MPWRRRNAARLRVATRSAIGKASIRPARRSASYIGSAIQLRKPARATRLFSAMTDRVSTTASGAVTPSETNSRRISSCGAVPRGGSAQR